jgi:hypothetical protein
VEEDGVAQLVDDVAKNRQIFYPGFRFGTFADESHLGEGAVGEGKG